MINQQMYDFLMSNPQSFMQQAQQQIGMFQQQYNMSNPQMNPMAIVQQKLSSGEMTQKDFEMLRAAANRMMGVNY